LASFHPKNRAYGMIVRHPGAGRHYRARPGFPLRTVSGVDATAIARVQQSV
jgi:hypothetical protein